MKKYETWSQLAAEMENDLKRYPLPICFNEMEERRELYLRKIRLRAIAVRWFATEPFREITRALKAKGVTCSSCWWQEGGRCYIEPCNREPIPGSVGSLSTKKAISVCSGHTSKRAVLGKFFPADKLIISSEEKNKAKGGDGVNY